MLELALLKRIRLPSVAQLNIGQVELYGISFVLSAGFLKLERTEAILVLIGSGPVKVPEAYRLLISDQMNTCSHPVSDPPNLLVELTG